MAHRERTRPRTAAPPLHRCCDDTDYLGSERGEPLPRLHPDGSPAPWESESPEGASTNLHPLGASLATLVRRPLPLVPVAGDYGIRSHGRIGGATTRRSPAVRPHGRTLTG